MEINAWHDIFKFTNIVLFSMEKRDVISSILFLTVSIALIFVNRNIRTHGFREFIYKEAVFYLLVPVILLIIAKRDPRKYGLALGDKRKIKKYFAILFLAAIPFMLIGASMREFQIYYPRFYFSNTMEFIYWELLVGLLMLSTEFFYRGFMLFGLKRTGRFSIIIQAVPYALVHLGKPMVEVYYSFFAGVAFGYIDMESKSILPSFLLHWSTSIIFDSLCVLLS